MKNQLKYIPVFLIAFVFGFSSYSAHAVELEKTFNYHQQVKPDLILTLNNKFGVIILESWDKPIVQGDIVVSVEAKTDKKAKELLDGIDIEERKNTDAWELRTRFKEKWSEKDKYRGDFKVDYVFKVPKSLTLSLMNQFGDIVLGTHTGKTNISLMYGHLVAESLSDRSSIRAQFGGVKVRKAQDLTIATNYSPVEVEWVEDLKLNSNYSEVKIQEFTKSAYISLNYGELKFTQAIAKAKKLNINSNFCDVYIRLSKNVTAQVNADMNMSKLKFPKSQATKEDINKSFSSNNYRLKFGNGESTLQIQITGSYGDTEIDVL